MNAIYDIFMRFSTSRLRLASISILKAKLWYPPPRNQISPQWLQDVWVDTSDPQVQFKYCCLVSDLITVFQDKIVCWVEQRPEIIEYAAHVLQEGDFSQRAAISHLFVKLSGFFSGAIASAFVELRVIIELVGLLQSSMPIESKLEIIDALLSVVNYFQRNNCPELKAQFEEQEFGVLFDSIESMEDDSLQNHIQKLAEELATL
jgi:hypothetical protein